VFAGEGARWTTLYGMPDDREKLTRQDLIFGAHGLRQAATLSDQRARDPKSGSSASVFEQSAGAQRRLADKFDRIAKQMPHG
jgi:hypothetical protein